MADVSVTGLVSLLPVLAAAYGVVMGAVGLAAGWQLFTGGQPRRFRRGSVVPPVGGTGPDGGGVL
ncbi:MAG: hypothetical protein ACRDRT_05875 [Pseudonocardiaceae bacterium]